MNAWFKRLSNLRKVGVILTSVALVGAVSASSSSHPTPVKPEVQPTITERPVSELKDIPYSTRTIDDPGIASGKTVLRQAGENGVQTITWNVSFSGDKEVGRVKQGDTVTTPPVDEIIAKGTFIQPPPATSSCDPNYTGCVPIASDVDCAGGYGNGPAYVQGPVRVIGSDIYDLDRDGDGIACQ